MYKISAIISGVWDNYAHKLRNILRMAVILLLMFISSLQASNTFGQGITYVQKQVSLIQVFKVIKKQTHYNVVWFEHNLNTRTTLDVNFKNATIAEVMERILSDQPASYEINGKTIVIKPKVPGKDEKLKKTAINAPEIDGEPLTGGKLEEVEINAGYYTVKDKERTGSISRITSETLAKQPISNVLEGINGRMAGVNITQQSGVAGGGFKVEIRGRNSLRSDAREPLYLVDGVPYPSTQLMNLNLGVTSIAGASPLNYLNAADIESIEVLKDADATAIYGSRGANGVILIKTKNAKTGKTSADINVQTGISKVGRWLDLLNTQQYLEMRKEAFKNDGVNPATTDYDVNGTWDQNRYTNWQKVLTGGTGHYTNIQTSIGGGNEFTQVGFRGNYSKQTTVFPGDFSDQKGSGALTLSHTSSDQKFRMNFSSSYLIDYNQLPQYDLSQYIFLPPNAPALFDINGELNWALDKNGVSTWTNPLAATRQQYTGKSNTFTSSGLLNYELLPGLSLRGNLGYTRIGLRETLLYPIRAFAPSDLTTGTNTIASNTLESWIMEPQINYQKQVFGGTLKLLLGSTFQKDRQNAEAITGSRYTSDLLLGNINAAPAQSATASASQYSYNALFGRINYDYEGKYLLNLTGRRDGSSRFGPDKQFANFGALGMAWIFTKEPIFKEQDKILSFGKLRASYGVTGSDQIPNYGYLDTYSASLAYQDGTGLIPDRLANPDYSWESNKKMEMALDLGFFRDKLLFSASYYCNRSSNQLVGFTLPDITGFASIQYNLPANVQNTGWEFELSSSNLSSKSFSWKTAFNLSLPKNKLLAFPNLKGSSYASLYAVGSSMYAPVGYHFIGVNPETGLHTFEDLNGNNKDTEEADKRAASESLTSHFYGGLQNTLTFKSFQIDLFFAFASKTARKLLVANAPGMIGNQLVEVMERWQNIGDDKAVEKFSQSSIEGGARQRYGYTYGNSDLFTDASFVKLRNVSISWNAPDSWKRLARLNNLRLYLQGQNLFTITKYPGDPEVLNVRALPIPMTVVAGIQIGL